ncbi:MAG TPA: sulfotransferase domain-containing protein [Terriglobales bacterium]|nr:sulfotransferase domain-containing protein [Terriglobales bacterium]
MVSRSRRLRHKIMRTSVRVPLIWLRHRGLDSHDVFLASYPRSGNTWTRFLLTEILSRESASFDNINQVIPEMGIHARAKVELPNGGRLIKTHEPYRKEYKRAVYLVRDFRDVMLSQYAREKELGLYNTNFDEYVEAYLDGRLSGFGAWQAHLPSWLDSPLARNGNLLLIRFEEMRKNPEPSISRIVEFLGLPVNPAQIRAAIANNSVERMRDKENAAQKLMKSAGEEGRFVRKGAVAGWRERFTEEQLRLVDERAGNVLVRMGYPLAFPEKSDPINSSLYAGRYAAN